MDNLLGKIILMICFDYDSLRLPNANNFRRFGQAGSPEAQHGSDHGHGDRVSHFRSGLMSLPEYESNSLRSEHSEEEEEAEDALPFPNLPDRLLVNIGLFGPYNEK
ncbi:hypothetical protein CEXT_294891 [Caerostris extrusa]|uniref:Uncharacterized protein n=1 Tax=Caerostris extrusa TaxID=172846 RepID=A0AAV4WQG6_CAEEX|nr:hypothetical protein CEXT_294891 [Caerostris extrusa]